MDEETPVDGYLRVHGGAVPRGASDGDGRFSLTQLWPDAPTGLLFIDVENNAARPDETVAERLRDTLRYAPEATCNRVSAVLVRTAVPIDPVDFSGVRDDIRARWEREPVIGTVHCHAGTDPSVAWSGDPGMADVEALARARATELGALLDWGNAIWSPAGFHYELPSGERRRSFVRLADVVRRPRDADVMAWWLLPLVTPYSSVLLDTSSIVPIVVALRAQMERHGMPLGNVGVRDEYPETRLEDRSLVEHLGGEGVLALLSVSSTGTTAQQLAEVLGARRGESPWRLETIVSRHGQTARRLDPVGTSGLGAPWLALPRADELEIDPTEPHVVVDPRSFVATSLPSPPVVAMPDPPNAARRMDDLLNLYQAVDGIGIECEHHHATQERRGRNRAAVRFYPELLPAAPGFLEAVTDRLGTPTESSLDGRDRGTLEALRDFDTIVCFDDEHAAPGFPELCGVVASVLGGQDRVVRVTRARHGDVAGLDDQLASARKVLVLSLGAVTGGSLQEIELRIRRATPGRTAGDACVLAALVVHARPGSFEDWRTARSSFGGCLGALWVTYLPWDTAPLRQETRALSMAPIEDVELQDFIEGRIAMPENPHVQWPERTAAFRPGFGVPNPRAVLWCPQQDAPDDDLPRLVAGSRMGHEATLVTTLVGVGALMHRSRLDAGGKGGPPWMAFDMTRIPRAYFEAPIIASVLRWLRPHEGRWHSSTKTVEDVLREMWTTTAEEPASHRILLVSELLLAAALGKVPRAGFEQLRAMAATVERELSEDDLTPVLVGRRLLELAAPP